MKNIHAIICTPHIESSLVVFFEKFNHAQLKKDLTSCISFDLAVIKKNDKKNIKKLNKLIEQQSKNKK